MKTRVLMAVVAICVLPATSQAFDKIVRLNGSVQEGNITAITPLQITIEYNGIDRPFPINEIASVTFDQEPIEMTTARRQLKSQQLEQALESINKINIAELPTKMLQQEAYYLKAYITSLLALAGSEDKTAAANMMLNFIGDTVGGNKTHHYLEALEMLGKLYGSRGAEGDFDRANKVFTKIEEVIGGGGDKWADYLMRTKVLKADVLMKQAIIASTEAEKKQHYSDAYKLYDAVLRSGSTSPMAQSQKTWAALGKAACLAAAGQVENGVGIVNKIIADNSPSDVQLFARTYNTLGACHRLADQPKDALLAYLHTDLLFYGDPESHAEALYYLSKLWTEIGRGDRGEQARRLLKSRYPGSVWNNM